jgi:predicted GIY-YIG superfamily endonuclease
VAAENYPEQVTSEVLSLSKGEARNASKGGYDMWYLYITANQNGAFYTGITSDLERRFKEHLRGKGGHYTKYNRPRRLIYTEKFNSRVQAEERERQIKCWSRSKKKALIDGDTDKLLKLSISRDHLRC